MAKQPATRSKAQQVQQAREAESLLNHPMISGALQAIEAKYMQQWLGSPIDDQRSREFCFRMVRTAQEFAALLQSFVEDGKLVAIEEAAEQRQRDSLED